MPQLRLSVVVYSRRKNVYRSTTTIINFNGKIDNDFCKVKYSNLIIILSAPDNKSDHKCKREENIYTKLF